PSLVLHPSSRYATSSFSTHAPPPTELYTLSLHDALPIWTRAHGPLHCRCATGAADGGEPVRDAWGASRTPAAAARRSVEFQHSGDRKSTRLNSSHVKISYAVFCLKKKKNKQKKQSTGI